jgi:hypothetical protein
MPLFRGSRGMFLPYVSIRLYIVCSPQENSYVDILFVCI